MAPNETITKNIYTEFIRNHIGGANMPIQTSNRKVNEHPTKNNKKKEK